MAENSHVRLKTELLNKDLQSIRRLAGALLKARSVKETCDLIVAECDRILVCDAICLFARELQEDGGETYYEMVSERGCTEEFKTKWRRVKGTVFPLLNIKEPYEQIFMGGKEDLIREIPSTEELANRSGRQWISYAPLVVNSEILGVLALSYNDVDKARFDKEFVMTLFNLCGQGLERARTYEQKLEREESLVREIIAKEQAVRTSQAKDEFLALISHELKTPLTSILLQVQLLRLGKLNESRSKIALENIEQHARIQNRIIEDLLDLSRVVSGKISIQPEKVDPALILSTALESVLPYAKKKDLELTSELGPEGRSISADPARLTQIFWNLLINAIKFTPAGGSIDVSLAYVEVSQKEVCEIKFSDSGIGMKQESLSQVFDRFWQAESRNGGSGLGLGLNIVKNFTELQGGKIKADSAGEGKGSTFTLSFPVWK